MTQTQMLLRHLRNNPGATSLEITLATNLVNVTGRVSDARAAGFVIECRKRSDGNKGYWIVESAQLTLGVA